MTRNITLTALACLIVAACGTPQEQCISRNTREYRTVSSLLAEVEGNLARGYAWAERPVTRLGVGHCRDFVRSKDGRVVPTYRTCFRDVTEIERYRVPIDPAAETRKRDNLAARKAQLARPAAAAVDACKATYPEDKG